MTNPRIIQEKAPPRTKSAFGTIVYPVMDEDHPKDYFYALGRVCLGEDRKTWCASGDKGFTTGFATRAEAEEDLRRQRRELEAKR